MISGSFGRVSSKSSKILPADVHPTSSLYLSLSSDISDSRRPNLIRSRRRFFFFAGADFGLPFGFLVGGLFGAPFGGGPRLLGGFPFPLGAGLLPGGGVRLPLGAGGLPFFLGGVGNFFFSLAASSKSSASTALAICCLMSASEGVFFFGGGGAFLTQKGEKL